MATDVFGSDTLRRSAPIQNGDCGITRANQHRGSRQSANAGARFYLLHVRVKGVCLFGARPTQPVPIALHHRLRIFGRSPAFHMLLVADVVRRRVGVALRSIGARDADKLGHHRWRRRAWWRSFARRRRSVRREVGIAHRVRAFSGAAAGVFERRRTP